MKYTKNLSDVKNHIINADAILVGIGSGMSASGGLDYTSEEVLMNLYPKYHKMGYKCIFDCIQKYWVTNINKSNEDDYWDFWTLHINNIRYKPTITKPYELLKNIIKNKEYFVITTNGDAQCQKTFDNVYAPQGDYSLFQCQYNCSNEVTYNKEFIDKYLLGDKSIPKCKVCGGYLIPNLRCDDFFSEEIALSKYNDYYNFVMNNKDRNLILIEIGVGYNTPGIIRFPFDKLSSLKNITLIRVNKFDANVSSGNISIEEDVLNVLLKLQ